MPITDKEKQRVWTKTNHAINSGKLCRGPCVVCGSTTNINAHHPDYSKPLDVTWLCASHHRLLHGHSDQRVLRDRSTVRMRDVHVRLSPAEFDAVRRVAKEQGKSVSELLRVALAAAVENCPLCGAEVGDE